MNQNYIHTITLYNRIQAADSEDRKEHWKRTVLHNCFWKAQVNIGFNGTQVSVQNTYVVRIPKDDRYLPYAEYKDTGRTARYAFPGSDCSTFHGSLCAGG